MRRSLARRGLDALLELHAAWEVLAVDWQEDGPWILVTIGQPSEGDGIDPVRTREAFARHYYAIWKNTGAVHGIQHDGAVTEDPLLRI